MAEIPAGLMAFIKQSPMAMPSIASLIPKSAGRRADPTVAQRAKQAYEQQQAEQAAAMFKDIAGQQGMAEQDMGPPTAQGEMSIEPATQGTGLYSNDPQRFITAASDMIQSGNPMLQKQGMDMMDEIQAGAAPQNLSSARTFAIGADDGQMQRAMIGPQGKLRPLGQAYDPRNQMLDVGTGFVDQYDPSNTVRKNLQQAASEIQQGTSEVLDWFKENNNLREAEGGRIAGMKKARKFLDAFEKGDMSSGGMRKLLNYLPFTFTEQGQMDEEFNSFAETAARQALKQSGEIRPTDADVTGMKRAMFGVGRDEKVNINLLQDFIDAAERGEYKQYLLSQGKDYMSSKKPAIGKNTSPSGINFTVK